MSFNWKETLLGPVMGMLENLGESKLEDVLDSIHAKDAEEHKLIVVVLHFGINKLKPYTDSSVTKLDDAAVAMISEAIANSALKYGISLTDNVVSVAPAAAA